MLRQARFKTVPHGELTLQDCMRKAVSRKCSLCALSNAVDLKGATPAHELVSAPATRLGLGLWSTHRDGPRLFLVQILARNIVFRYLVGTNFLLVSVLSALDTSNDIGFECIAFLEQLVDALRIRNFEVGQPL
jgi:hypothetical protein